MHFLRTFLQRYRAPPWQDRDIFLDLQLFSTTLQSRLLDRICPSPEEGKVNDGDIGGVAGTACDESIDDRRECEDGARLLPNMELGFLKKVNTAHRAKSRHLLTIL